VVLAICSEAVLTDGFRLVGGRGSEDILIADPGTNRDAAPAHAAGEAAHGVALTAAAVLDGNGACGAAVKGRAETIAEGVVATAQAGAFAADISAVDVEIWCGGLVAGRPRFGSQGRRQVGRLVLRRAGAKTRGRGDVDGSGGACHVSQGGGLWRGVVCEQREAAVARVLEEEVGLEQRAARGAELVRLAGPRKVELAVPLGAAKLRRRSLLYGGADGGGVCCGLALAVAGDGRVAEGWGRLLGIQFNGRRGTG